MFLSDKFETVYDCLLCQEDNKYSVFFTRQYLREVLKLLLDYNSA